MEVSTAPTWAKKLPADGSGKKEFQQDQPLKFLHARDLPSCTGFSSCSILVSRSGPRAREARYSE